MIQPVIPGGAITEIELSKAGVTSYTVPANQVYWISWLALKYVCSADVGDRTCKIQVTWTDAATNTTLARASTAMTASQTWQITYGIGSGEVTIDALSYDFGSGGGPLPLYPGMKLIVTITGAFAGDSWTMEGVMFITPFGTP